MLVRAGGVSCVNWAIKFLFLVNDATISTPPFERWLVGSSGCLKKLKISRQRTCDRLFSNCSEPKEESQLRFIETICFLLFKLKETANHSTESQLYAFFFLNNSKLAFYLDLALLFSKS